MKGDISLKQAVEEYKDIYLAYRNFAPRTRIEYVNDNEDMVKYLERVGVHSTKDINLPHLIHYFAELEKRGFTGSTRKRKTISIRSFLSFLHMENYILSDIGKRIIPPYIEIRKPKVLTPEEINRLLDCSKKNIRDYAIIQILIHTGIRLSELTRLSLHDLQTTNEVYENGQREGYLRIISNQRIKERCIPLNSNACSAIYQYISGRDSSNTERLFLNKFDAPISERGVEKIISKYYKQAGILNASVVSLRHTFGTNQTKRGRNIKELQKVMGHKDTRTTARYKNLA